ncbi:MAG: glycosyl hydrolase, partial [Oxalobacteraceae bacterium]
VVVLETGGPVTMPWIEDVSAVLAAWYPGQRGGEAIARILTGAVNPSGHLPVTFPRSIEQTPNPELPGSKLVRDGGGKSLYDLPKDQPQFDVRYPEGADVGYRWYERTNARPLFAFGHGMSYTRFSYSGLSLEGGANVSASFRLTNIGKRAGAEVAQLYAKVGGVRRLIGWRRVDLKPGESRQVTVTGEPRLLASFDIKLQKWVIAAGSYAIDVAAAADQPILIGTTDLNPQKINP